MPKQLQLFTSTGRQQKPKAPPIPHNARPTSKAAAESVKPIFSAKAQELYEYILSCGSHGCTDQEAQLALGESGDSHRPRRDRLAAAGMIIRNGKTRPTKSGRPAEVWIAVACRDADNAASEESP